jgi:hypothetical protein
MNRFVRTFVSAGSVLGALAAAPSVAHAQAVNVAPPAYGYAPPSEPGRAPYGGGAYGIPYDYGRNGYANPYDARGGLRREPGREAGYETGREGWDRVRQHHLRECTRAYESGAPPWVLQRMRCPM